MSEPTNADAPEVDWLLLSRYALMVSLCELIPLPIVDGSIANMLRRRLVRHIARDHGHDLSAEDVGILGTAPGGGCLGCVFGVVLWPIKKVLKTIFFFLNIKTMADIFSDVYHRGLMLHEAFEQDWLPGDAAAVRHAMDASVLKIDTRLVERALMGTYRDGRAELNMVVYHATEALRAQTREARAEEMANNFELTGMDEQGEEMSKALAASMRGLGTAPELIQWFKTEMEIRVDHPELTEEVGADEP